MAQNPFSSSLLLLGAPPLRMDFSAPRTEVERTLKYSTHRSPPVSLVFTGSLFNTGRKKHGMVGWDGTLCVRHYYGEAVWLKTGHT